MINENIELKDKYFELSLELIKRLENSSLLKKDKVVIGVCGESGSGKSVTAKCLQIQLQKLHIDAVILHQDCYYKLTPKENHEKRKLDINWVGVNELNVDLLQTHIEQFKNNKEQIITPVVDYEQNVFFQENTIFKNKKVLIVEGVYSFFLQELDYKIFMERTYKETLEKRKERTREVYDPFVERVLDIEQGLILPLKKLADVSITSQYLVRDKGQ